MAALLLCFMAGGFSLKGDDKCDERFIKDICEYPKQSITLAAYYEKVSRKVIYVTHALLSYEIVRTCYTGGAHDNYYSKRGTIFRKTGKKLTLKDIAPEPAQKRMLLALIKRAIMKSRNIKSLKELEKKNITPVLTEKFYYTKKGLHFFYDPYKIACFAEGTFEICVPWGVPDFVQAYEKEMRQKGY